MDVLFYLVLSCVSACSFFFLLFVSFEELKNKELVDNNMRFGYSLSLVIAVCIYATIAYEFLNS